MIEDLAKAAYVYGYPLVYDLTETIAITTKSKVAMGAPANLFAHATALASPGDAFVSLNNDTLYSVAPVDVTGGAARPARAGHRTTATT